MRAPEVVYLRRTSTEVRLQGAFGRLPGAYVFWFSRVGGIVRKLEKEEVRLGQNGGTTRIRVGATISVPRRDGLGNSVFVQ